MLLYRSSLQNPINTGLRKYTQTFKTLSILAIYDDPFPSKPYQYWHGVLICGLQNPINTGLVLLWISFKTLSILASVLLIKPSKPYQYWPASWIGGLQNPINTGGGRGLTPSKPYQYWQSTIYIIDIEEFIYKNSYVNFPLNK